MGAKKKARKPRKPVRVSHYLTGWAEDPQTTSRHLAEVLIDALCALKRLQLQGALQGFPEWRGEGSAVVQLGAPTGADAAYLKKHPFLPAQTPLMVITASEELASLIVGFAKGVSTRWRRRVVTGTANGPANLPPVMMVSGADVVVADNSIFAEARAQFEEAGWTVRELGNVLGKP